MTRVLVQAVPWSADRLASVAEIREQVPDLEIVWDTRMDAMHTWKRVLETAGASPVVILEDDVILTSNWREKVERVIEARGEHVIQFFSRGESNEAAGSRFKTGSTFSMNQCYYLPAGLAAELLHYAEGWQQKHPEHPSGYDLLMGSYLKENRMRYWAEIPSLVQHREGESLIGPRSSKRQSGSFQP